jgi:hypothetical protein
MSIYSEILSRSSEGRLFALPPLMPPQRGNAPRQLYVSPEINALCNTGPWLNGKWMSRCMALRAALDRFSQGGVIPIAARPLSGGKSSFMRQLFRWREEVWEIRSLEEPGIRVLGRFADTDLFIALTWHKRADLLGPKSRQWRDAIIGCKTNWVNLFPAYPPKSGGSNAYPTDYISANTILV